MFSVVNKPTMVDSEDVLLSKLNLINCQIESIQKTRCKINEVLLMAKNYKTTVENDRTTRKN